MRQHVNDNHVKKGIPFQVNDDIVQSSNSVCCPICRRWFSKNEDGQPRQHDSCKDVQAGQPQQSLDEPDREEGAAQAEEGGAASAPTQTFAEWLRGTTDILKEFNAAGLRNDSDAQQSTMLSFIQRGPKQPKTQEGTQHFMVPDHDDAEELARLLGEARSAAARAAAEAPAPADGDAASVERILRVVKHLENGEISEARRAISQKGGLREATMLGMQQLKQKYFPPARPDADDFHPPPNPPPNPVQVPEFTIEEVTAYLLPRKAKSPDAWGWTARGLLAVLQESAENIKGVLGILRMIMGGVVTITNPELVDALLTFLGHCIPKIGKQGDDGVAIRPACSPCLFLQMAISITLRRHVDEQRTLIGNGQVGIAVPAGGEAYARSAQLDYEYHTQKQTPDFVILTVDVENFYHAIDKAACRNAGATLAPVAAIAQLVHSQPALAIYRNKDANTVYRMEIPNGTVQGLSLSGFCAAKAMNDVASLVRADHLEVSMPFFHDDGRMSGRFDDVIAAFDDLVKRFKERINCAMNAKTGILLVDPACLTEVRRAQLAARNIPEVVGIVQAGIPVGSERWIHECVDKTVESIRAGARDVVGVQGKHARLTRKALTNVVRLTTTCAFTHLLRGVAPDTIQEAARRVDRIAVAAALSTSGLGHISPKTQHVSERAGLPVAFSGAGLGSAALARDAAYISSFAATAKVVSTLVQPEVTFLPSLPMVQELSRAIRRVQAICKDSFSAKSEAEKAVMGLTAAAILAEDFKPPEHLQGTITTMLARAQRDRIAAELKAAGRDAELRSFLSCGGCKAGNFLVAGDRLPGTAMDDMQFTVAYSLRLGVEAFADIKPGHKCRLCGKAIGTSATHGALCTREGTGMITRNERHYALNNEIARILRWLDPSTRIRFEPFIVNHFHKQPKDWKRDGRRRGDLHVRTATENYIIDTSVGLAAAASAPAAANTKAGVVARKLAKDKVVQYISTFTNFKEHEIVPCCAEAEGSLDVFFEKFIQRRIDDGWLNNPTRPKSTIAAEVYARLSTALQRGNADGVINWRYAECGEAIHDADSDPVRAALNSPAIDLAECDRDLRKRRRVAAGGVAAGGVAAALADAVPVAAE